MNNVLTISVTGGNQIAVGNLQKRLEEYLAGFGQVIDSFEPSTSTDRLLIWESYTDFEANAEHKGKIGHLLSMLPAPSKVFVHQVGVTDEEYDFWVLQETGKRILVSAMWRHQDVIYSEVYFNLPVELK